MLFPVGEDVLDLVLRDNILIYIAPLASDHIVRIPHIDNVVLQCFDNSIHIATSIANILLDSKRIIRCYLLA